MMYRLIFLVLLTRFLSAVETVKSQDLPFRKEVNYIDSVLLKNPYFENSLEITYSYSLDITDEKELIVKMDFNGPFTTTFTARLTDLNNTFMVDTTEYNSSVCWLCREDETGKEKRCIKQENLYTTGEKDIVDSDNICIMLTTQSKIRFELIKAIEELVKKVLE